MKTFIHLDANGHIIGTSSAPDSADAGDDPLTKEVHVPDGVRVSAYSHSYVNGMLVPVPSRTPQAPPYTDRRRDAYPPIGEQLDALWHAMDAGHIPKVAAFYDPIATVKAAHPKG